MKTLINDKGFSFQKPIFGSVVDFINFDIKLIIEVQGCFFHAHFCKWDRNSLLSPIQYHAIEKDAKLLKNANKHGYEILYVWECEIEADLNKVDKKIHDAIRKRT